MSRFMLLAVVLALVAGLVAAQGDPQTYCAPVGIDLFSVTASSPATEGGMLANVTGVYPRQFYSVFLPTNYFGPDVFFNIVLTPNTTVQATIVFTISLNGVFKMANGEIEIFTNPADGATNDIEFTNWETPLRFGATVNNTLHLAVNETITAEQDVTLCHYVYDVVFVNPYGIAPSTGAFTVGDPQFRGLRGQDFQVHGVDGAVYNLISDKSMQLNTRFTFLEGPRPCAVMPSTGKKSAACWSHPGSYLGELALRTIGESQLLIVAGPAASGFASVSLDGQPLEMGASADLEFADSGLTGTVELLNTHELTIHAGHFDLVVENNDGFVNLRSVSVPAASWTKLSSHGLLGQTWQNRRYDGKIKDIEGDVDDYLIEDDDLFGTSFLYNRFTPATA